MTVQLICGDCLEVMKSIPDKSVDAVITDPPYGTTKCGWDKAVDLYKMWEQINRISKNNAIIVIFSSQPFTTDLICSNRKYFRYELIWEKSISSMFFDANKRPLKSHENVIIFSKVGVRGGKNKLQTTYNPQMEKGKPYIKQEKAVRSVHYGESLNDYTIVNKGERFPKSVLKFNNGNNCSNHPTEKPIKLMSWLAMTYANKGDTILDPFMGSGTTGVACVQTGRNFIGIEIDETYYNIAKKRIDEALMQPRLDTV